MFSKKNGSITLSAFVRGMVQSLIDAQDAIRYSRERNLKEYMAEDEDGSLTPDMHTIRRPDDTVLHVPKYSLYRANTIGITRSEISCSTRIVDFELVDDDSRCGEMITADRHARFWVKPACQGSKNTFEMKIEFEQRDPGESEERLIEALDALVEVQPRDARSSD